MELLRRPSHTPSSKHISVISPVTALIHSSSVLRRRFQVNTMNGIGYEYKGLWDAIRIIFRQEGPKGFYKGLLPNLLKVAPSMGASFLSYEITRDLLNGFTGGSV